MASFFFPFALGCACGALIMFLNFTGCRPRPGGLA